MGLLIRGAPQWAQPGTVPPKHSGPINYNEILVIIWRV